MEFHKDEDVAESTSTIEGAIFMSNRTTKKESLARKLFALPHSQASLVKQVKSGMILFLFEYEERKLFGVFEAVSDGALNIEPYPFNSFRKPFTAQIRIQRIWSCYPLSEPEFSVAIKDNYYTTQKFHLHLSQEQVHNLLALFSIKRICVQRPRMLRAHHKAPSQSQGHGRGNSRETITSDSVDNELDMNNVAQPANFSRHPPDFSGLDLNHHGRGAEPILKREDFIGKQSLYLPASCSPEPSLANFTLKYFAPKSHEDGAAVGHLHINPVQSHHSCVADHSFCYTQPSFSSHVLEGSTLVHGIDAYSRGSRDFVLPSGSHLPIRPHTLDQSSTRHESLGIPANQSGHRISSVLDQHELSSSSAHSLGTGYLENRSRDSNSADYIDLSFTNTHEITGASIPFTGARYFERRNMNSSDGGHRDLSLTDHYEPSRSTVPFLQAASFRKKNIGGPSFMFSPSKNLLELGNQDESPAFYENEDGCIGEINGCYEASNTASFLSGDRFASNTDSTGFLDGPNKDLRSIRENAHALKSHDYEGWGHHSSTHHKEYHLVESGLHSDHHENRPSVFSRLSAAEDDGSNESDVEISISFLTKILSRRRKEWRKSVKYSNPLSQRISEGQTIGELATSVQINEEDMFVDEETTEVSWGSPFLNFKRRSQVQKTHDGEGRHFEAKENEESSSGRKRRKLIRPPLVPEEHFDKAITNAKEVEAPVDNDRRDEFRERNMSPQAGHDSATCPNSNSDDGEILESLGNHILRNIIEQSQVLSDDSLESAKEIERNASGPSLELQMDQLSGRSVDSEQNVENVNSKGNAEDLLEESRIKKAK